VRIKHSRKYAKTIAHAVYDILRPSEAAVYLDQNPGFEPRVSERDDTRLLSKKEVELQDPLTQIKLQKIVDKRQRRIDAKRLAKAGGVSSAEVVGKDAPVKSKKQKQKELIQRKKELKMAKFAQKNG